MYKRAVWKDEVVVWVNERARSPIGDVWVWAYGVAAFLITLPLLTLILSPFTD